MKISQTTVYGTVGQGISIHVHNVVKLLNTNMHLLNTSTVSLFAKYQEAWHVSISCIIY